MCNKRPQARGRSHLLVYWYLPCSAALSSSIPPRWSSAKTFGSKQAGGSLPRTHPFRPSQKPRVCPGGAGRSGAASVGTRQLLGTWAACWSLGAPDLLSSLLCTPGLQEEQVDGSDLFFSGTGPRHWDPLRPLCVSSSTLVSSWHEGLR